MADLFLALFLPFSLSLCSSNELNTQLSYDPTIPYSVMYPKELNVLGMETEMSPCV